MQPTFWGAVYWLCGIGQPLHPDPAPFIDVSSPTVQALIAAAEAHDDRQFCSYVAWSYSRDRVVERRELECETPEYKNRRLMIAAFDRAQAANQQRRIA
jgi:hypothetical protein